MNVGDRIARLLDLGSRQLDDLNLGSLEGYPREVKLPMLLRFTALCNLAEAMLNHDSEQAHLEFRRAWRFGEDFRKVWKEYHGRERFAGLRV